ncbi:MAG: hypothetical protein AB8B95_14475 [Pseudohongiellaceae bacterium]
MTLLTPNRNLKPYLTVAYFFNLRRIIRWAALTDQSKWQTMGHTLKSPMTRQFEFFGLTFNLLYYYNRLNSLTKYSFLLFVKILFSASCFQNTAVGQEKVVKEFKQIEQAAQLDDLSKEFGRNKKLPPGYELQTLIALSHYPELVDIKIEFIVDDVGIPLSSRPYWGSMLRSAKKRTYLVVIDKQLEGPRAALLLRNQPFNAQIGIIGHELSHTAYYLQRSFIGIIQDALCQLSQCKIQFERATDRRLIEHGLGWQRLAHASFVRARLQGPQYTDNPTAEGRAYMSPAELIKVMNNNKLYTQ